MLEVRPSKLTTGLVWAASRGCTGRTLMMTNSRGDLRCPRVPRVLAWTYTHQGEGHRHTPPPPPLPHSLRHKTWTPRGVGGDGHLFNNKLARNVFLPLTLWHPRTCRSSWICPLQSKPSRLNIAFWLRSALYTQVFQPGMCWDNLDLTM
ncbi:hypothetical protein RRG08_016765 [Elysia crispata]|uniref:Uncharacterized protein n=1 Tax=Elysia crispata TaxID=231223 RepID=A0AAE1A0J2_9GAST|nr:hypothetical protein RRG08_016765 [Elysia crispata]